MLKGLFTLWMVGIGVVILLAGAGLVLVFTGRTFRVDWPGGSSDGGGQVSFRTPTTLVNQTVHVPARDAVAISFTVPSTGRVEGSFYASGGKNDIDVYVVDAAGLTNFRNGNVFRYLYHSGGYMTTGAVDLNLSPGTYHVILNNRQAVMTNKTVSVNLTGTF